MNRYFIPVFHNNNLNETIVVFADSVEDARAALLRNQEKKGYKLGEYVDGHFEPDDAWHFDIINSEDMTYIDLQGNLIKVLPQIELDNTLYKIGCLGFKPEKDNPYPLCDQPSCLLRYTCNRSTHMIEDDYYNPGIQ